MSDDRVVVVVTVEIGDDCVSPSYRPMKMLSLNNQDIRKLQCF